MNVDHAIIPEEVSDEIPIPVFTSSVPQIIYIDGEPIEISPRKISFIHRDQYLDVFNEVNDLDDYLNFFDKISIRRTYALGDVMILWPFFKFLRKRYPTKQLILRGRKDFNVAYYHVPWLTLVDEFDSKASGISSNEIVLDLDKNTFECDHSRTHPFHNIHRLEILYSLLKVDPSKRICDYTFEGFDTQCQSFVDNWISSNKIEKFIIFPYRGSNPIKSFPIPIRHEIIKFLADNSDFKVIVTDVSSSPPEKFEYDNVYWFLGNSFHSLLCLYRKATMVISTDSSSLWFSHFSSCPIILFLGPTTKETRLKFHPLYPDLAQEFSLFPYIDSCKSACYHLLDTCKNQIDCFKPIRFEKFKITLLKMVEKMQKEIHLINSRS